MCIFCVRGFGFGNTCIKKKIYIMFSPFALCCFNREEMSQLVFISNVIESVVWLFLFVLLSWLFCMYRL